MPFTDPVLIFASVMVLILVSPMVARRLRLPDIVGLIVAGMVFGEHGLGLLARDDTMKLLGQVGLLMIMFLAGLEIDLHQAKQQRSHSFLFGMLTFLFPLALGIAGGKWLFGMALPPALLLASMFSSHTLLTFPSVGKLQLGKTRAVITTIGGTILTDVLALLILAVVSAGSKGSLDAAFWFGMSSKMLVYTGLVLLLAPPVGRWFLRHFSDDDNLDFIAILAIAFTVSYLAHVAGLEPIIGAFLAGLTLNSLIPEKGALMRKLHFVGNALFIPFFLLSIGMLVNIELLWQGVDTWLIILFMVTVALFSKWLAARVFGFMLKYSPDEQGLIFGLSVNQAAATLAAALVGYDLGLFDDSIITGTIAMIAVTCFVGPVMTEKYGRRLAERRMLDSDASGDFPHRIIIPIHSRSRSKDILDLALFLRKDGSHEPLYPVNVVFESPDAEREIAESEKLLDHLVMNSLGVDVPMIPLVVIDTNVAGGILRTAREKRTSILCMLCDGDILGYKKRFGRTIDQVIDSSTQLVLVSRLQQPLSTTQRILLVCPPLCHLLPEVSEAIGVVKTIARQSGAKLRLLLVSDAANEQSRLVKKCRPPVDMTVHELPVWRHVRSAIVKAVSANDWVVVLAARTGQIAWQPMLDRLPKRLIEALPGHNLSFIYPPLEAPDPHENHEELIVDDEISRIIRLDQAVFQVEEGHIRQGLELLFKPFLQKTGLDARRLIDSLTASAEETPVELLPGLILLHEHCPEVKQSEFFLITFQNPLDLPLLSTHCRLVLVLLDPLEQDPVQHLAALNELAHLIKRPGFIAKALTASNWQELVQN
ncbi:MAG: cation:proton antiporter [Lentisphaeria bacterium]|nr:cation:proton antiporter [Lentisphaeria bacterium]